MLNKTLIEQELRVTDADRASTTNVVKRSCSEHNYGFWKYYNGTFCWCMKVDGETHVRTEHPDGEYVYYKYADHRIVILDNSKGFYIKSDWMVDYDSLKGRFKDYEDLIYEKIPFYNKE